jgi:hypothetical protein
VPQLLPPLLAVRRVASWSEEAARAHDAWMREAGVWYNR